MKFSELKGRAVVNIVNSVKLGELADILVDPTTRQTQGLHVKTGLFGQGQTVPVSEIKNVGQDAITYEGGTAEAPQAGTTEPMSVASVMNNKVITDTGTLVGEVSDVILDPTTLAVTAYEVRGGGLFAKAQEIPITQDVRHGDHLITVPAQHLNQA